MRGLLHIIEVLRIARDEDARRVNGWLHVSHDRMQRTADSSARWKRHLGFQMK